MLLESSLRGRCSVIMTVSNCDLITFIHFHYVIRFYGIIDVDDHGSYDCIGIFRNTSCYARANAYKYINIVQLILLHCTLYIHGDYAIDNRKVCDAQQILRFNAELQI